MTVIEAPTTAAAAEFTVDKKEILAAINSVILAASKDETRNVLTQVRIIFDVSAGTVKFTTCDSYRLHEATIQTVIIERNATIFVSAKELVAALPKASDLRGDVSLTLVHFPGRAELDAGELLLKWGSQQRLIRADSDKSMNWPDTDRFWTDFATDFHHNGTSAKPVGLSSTYVGDITKAGKSINKDKPMAYTPGSTPLKPTIWELRVSSVFFRALLMPVRLEETY